MLAGQLFQAAFTYLAGPLAPVDHGFFNPPSKKRRATGPWGRGGGIAGPAARQCKSSDSVCQDFYQDMCPARGSAHGRTLVKISGTSSSEGLLIAGTHGISRVRYYFIGLQSSRHCPNPRISMITSHHIIYIKACQGRNQIKYINDANISLNKLVKNNQSACLISQIMLRFLNFRYG